MSLAVWFFSVHNVLYHSSKVSPSHGWERLCRCWLFCSVREQTVPWDQRLAGDAFFCSLCLVRGQNHRKTAYKWAWLRNFRLSCFIVLRAWILLIGENVMDDPSDVNNYTCTVMAEGLCHAEIKYRGNVKINVPLSNVKAVSTRKYGERFILCAHAWLVNSVLWISSCLAAV